MIKARFYIKKSDCGNDYRPVKWPIKYPYWCSGESDDSFILVAYAEDEDSNHWIKQRMEKRDKYR